MARWLGVLIVVALGSARPAVAEARACDAAFVTEGQALLEAQAAKARRWDLGWGTTYAVVAGLEFGLVAAEWKPLGTFDADFRAGALIGGIKASIGLASKLVLPMRIPRVVSSTEACADRARVAAALALAARRQRRSFYLNLLGGLAVNGAGALTLGLYYDTWTQAAVSFGSGLVASVLSLVTMPRGAWRARARVDHGETLVLAPTAVPGGGGLALAGAF